MLYEITEYALSVLGLAALFGLLVLPFLVNVLFRPGTRLHAFATAMARTAVFRAAAHIAHWGQHRHLRTSKVAS